MLYLRDQSVSDREWIVATQQNVGSNGIVEIVEEWLGTWRKGVQGKGPIPHQSTVSPSGWYAGGVHIDCPLPHKSLFKAGTANPLSVSWPFGLFRLTPRRLTLK